MNAKTMLSRAQVILIATVALMVAAILAISANTANSAAGGDHADVTQAKTKEWKTGDTVVLAATKEWKTPVK